MEYLGEPKRCRRPLPIDGYLPAILASLESAPSLVLEAPPGTGKTTRVPEALLGASWRRREDQILVLEPRRLAAKLAARFVAAERGESVGETVGYQFRFENVGGPRTRLRFLTEGTLVRWLLSRPDLAGVSAVVLDEFHERHLHTDIALAYLQWLRRTRRPDLRLVVMSATLDAAPLAAFLGDCPVIRAEGRMFPVEVRHRDGPPARPLEQEVKVSVGEVTSAQPTGDVLVFLPGMGEIRRAEEALRDLAARRDLAVHPLHGELSPEEQDRAVSPGPRRKVILSTNVAETSLTIEGVTAVVDSGLHRRASYSWWSGMPALTTRPISRASAIQRAGRAGRTAPGLCLRLYTQHDFNRRPALEVPELHRSDLAQTVLELKAIGIGDVGAFPWFEPPPAEGLQAAVELLHRLGALDAPEGKAPLTELGRRLALLPVGPRLGRVLLEAERRNVLGPALRFVVDWLAGSGERLGRRIEGQIRSALGNRDFSSRPEDWEARLGFCLLAGFPDRVARKRLKGSEAELVIAGGGSARTENLPGDWFVVLEAQERKGRGQARSDLKATMVHPIREEWLFDLEPCEVKEKNEPAWDPQRQRVTALSALVYGNLTLTSTRADPPADERTLALLLKSALSLDTKTPPLEWPGLLAPVADREAVEATLARVQLVSRHLPNLGVKDPAEADLFSALAPSLLGLVSRQDLAAQDWPALIAAALLGGQAHRLDQWAPPFVTLARGRRVRVQYRWNQVPWIESRLQDFFGMAKGPTLLDGRVPLTLHLLAPNHRAVQVTTDLAGFWSRHYPELRRTLKIRYPKHAWPENPLA